MNAPAPIFHQTAESTFLAANLSFSVYSGRKKDSKTGEEVQHNKNAQDASAASVYKYLFAGSKELAAVVKVRNRITTDHYRLTTPFSDNGSRLLHVSLMGQYQQMIQTGETDWADAVQTFLDRYDLLVAAAAFKLGDLFDRREYPTRAQVARKFAMRSTLEPVMSGSTPLLQTMDAAVREIHEGYAALLDQRMAAAQRESWIRLHSMLARLSKQLTVSGDGKKATFHATMIQSILDECERLRAYNVQNDPALEHARQQVAQSLLHLDADTLRKDLDTRAAVKNLADQLLAGRDWSDVLADADDADDTPPAPDAAADIFGAIED